MSFEDMLKLEEQKIVGQIKQLYSRLSTEAQNDVASAVSFFDKHMWLMLGASFATGCLVGAIIF